ncbi:hypothetical protein L1887_17563 [Cichorium endivia]|nr:hypothetical protein L1887_17563 [Cichorium endivia]
MSSDTITIGEALGEKVGKFIQLATTFVGGFLISFIRGWRLSLVVSLCMPLMVVAGGYMSFVISKTSAIVQSTYAEAGNVVEEMVRGIRTVASFNGEKHSINKYDDKLEVAYSATCRQGLASGLGTAGCLLVSRCSYGLAIWYGSKLILQEKDYNGGEVITIILAMTIGAFSLGQTTPCLSAFAEGRAAAYTMFETINRNHEELMKDPKGAYAQLVQMQSVKSHQAEEKEVVVDNELAHIQQSLSHESSAKRLSANNRSSGHLLCPTNVQEMGTVRDHKEEMAACERVKRIPIKRIAYLNKPELLVLFLGSIAAVAHGLLVPIYGLILSSAIKIFYEPPNKLQKDTKFWALMFVGLGICSFIFVPLQNYLFGVAGGKLIQRIRLLSFQKIVHQEMSWFDKPEHSRLATDASIVRNVVGDALALVVQNLATITGGLMIAFTANWILALVILSLLPLISMQGFIQMKFYKDINANSKVMYEKASQVASDAVGNIRTVSSFSAEEKMIDMYQKKCEQPIKQAVKTGIVCGAGFGFSSFTFLSITSLCFYTGSVLQQHGRITFAEIFRVFFCLSTLSSGLSQAATLFSDMNKARESIASIFEILDSKPKIDSSLESGMSMDSVKGDIELQHVSFKYPSRPDFQVFKDLSLTIASGKTVAVVGESGSGKSTIIGLIERFYDPDSGHIYLDGIDIKTLKSEHVVQDALDKVMVGRTSIVVAHRLSTIKGADIIAVVKNGVIAEKGTHDELLKISGGVYASLVSLQTASA